MELISLDILQNIIFEYLDYYNKIRLIKTDNRLIIKKLKDTRFIRDDHIIYLIRLKELNLCWNKNITDEGITFLTKSLTPFGKQSLQ